MDVDEMEEETSEGNNATGLSGINVSYADRPNSEEASTPAIPSTSTAATGDVATPATAEDATAENTSGMQTDEEIPIRSHVTWNLSACAEIIAPSDTVTDVTVSLHPLVILNISEHWTRYRVDHVLSNNVEAVGALIGKHIGRHVEVMNSYELVFFTEHDGLKISEQYYAQKEQQYKQVFTDLDIVGWYRTGEDVNHSDLFMHRQMSELIDSPLFLKLRPSSYQSELPIYVYESVSDVIDGVHTLLQFLPIKYTLATEEAERIGVDHVARISSNETTNSSIASENMKAQQNAIKMLASRVHVIGEFVRATQKGDVPFNHDIMRQINAMSHRLPMCNDIHFSKEFYTEANEVALMAYLASVTKCNNALNRFVNRFNRHHERCGLGRRRRGILF